MGILSSIKNAIWGSGEPAAKAKPGAPATAPHTPAPAPAPTAPAAPEPLSEAEMMERIGKLPGASDYNWRTSIVDLMKLTGIDPSFDNRRELADELGMTGYEGTVEQNIALHHAVLNLLALEGGKVGGILED